MMYGDNKTALPACPAIWRAQIDTLVVNAAGLRTERDAAREESWRLGKNLEVCEAERDALRAEAERLRDVLRAVEWGGLRSDSYGARVERVCPRCGATLTAGEHALGCEIHAALKEGGEG